MHGQVGADESKENVKHPLLKQRCLSKVRRVNGTADSFPGQHRLQGVVVWPGFNWIDAANNHHLEAKKITSRSEISGLAQKGILLEITTNTEGYLWKFIIPN